MENVREFRLSFSSGPFPEWDGELVLVETEPGGPRYRLTGVKGEPSGRLFLLDVFSRTASGALLPGRAYRGVRVGGR